MPQVDLVDETFVVADPEIVAEVVRDPHRWTRWWPDLRLTVFEDRGRQGVRWNVTGALVGSMEVWLEPHGDGVIAHYYLRADPTEPGRPTLPRTLPGRAAAREVRRRRQRARRIFWAIKDGLEGARVAGESREPDVDRDPATPRRRAQPRASISTQTPASVGTQVRQTSLSKHRSSVAPAAIAGSGTETGPTVDPVV